MNLTIFLIHTYWDLRNLCHHLRWAFVICRRTLKIKLIRSSMISMEKYDCFGGGIIHPNLFCSLFLKIFTSLINFFYFKTKLRRWNFCCWVTLLYLNLFLNFFPLLSIILYLKMIISYLKILETYRYWSIHNLNWCFWETNYRLYPYLFILQSYSKVYSRINDLNIYAKKK
jgi:hypothetical protein